MPNETINRATEQPIEVNVTGGTFDRDPVAVVVLGDYPLKADGTSKPLKADGASYPRKGA